MSNNSEEIKFENNSRIKRYATRLLIGFLGLFPKGALRMIKKSNKSARHVVENKTSHDALETLYHRGEDIPDKGLVQRVAKKVWFNLDNSRAVRNRLKIVRHEISQIVTSLDEESENINILSIASGSARSIVEAIRGLDIPEHHGKINLFFLDKSPKALAYSKKLVSDLLPKYKASWIEDTASSFPKHLSAETMPHIVEMVGLLDYFTPEKTGNLLKIIYDNMQDGGYLVTANIIDNHEREFLTKVIGWEMIYKNPEQLAKIATEAGFNMDKMRIVHEPLGIHFVLVAQK